MKNNFLVRLTLKHKLLIHKRGLLDYPVISQQTLKRICLAVFS